MLGNNVYNIYCCLKCWWTCQSNHLIQLNQLYKIYWNNKPTLYTAIYLLFLMYEYTYQSNYVVVAAINYPGSQGLVSQTVCWHGMTYMVLLRHPLGRTPGWTDFKMLMYKVTEAMVKKYSFYKVCLFQLSFKPSWR